MCLTKGGVYMLDNGFVEMREEELMTTEGGSIVLLGFVVLCVGAFCVGCCNGYDDSTK